jgi:hypothetical protein
MLSILWNAEDLVMTQRKVILLISLTNLGHPVVLKTEQF